MKQNWVATTYSDEVTEVMWKLLFEHSRREILRYLKEDCNIHEEDAKVIYKIAKCKITKIGGIKNEK